MAWDELERLTEKQERADRDKWIGVYIASLAVLLALCSMGGGNAAKNATLKNIEATNTWAFFQAKNMRRHVLRLQVDEFEIRLATDKAMTEADRAAITAKVEQYRKQDESLTKDPDKPEGQREGLDQLWSKGKVLEAERDEAMRQDPYFDYAEAFLQIAIVLASVAIISRHSMLLLGVSGTLGLMGALMTLNGFTLAFEFLKLLRLTP